VYHGIEEELNKYVDLLIASKSLARSISSKETMYSARFIMILSTKIYELYVMATIVETLKSLDYRVRAIEGFVYAWRSRTMQ